MYVFLVNGPVRFMTAIVGVVIGSIVSLAFCGCEIDARSDDYAVKTATSEQDGSANGSAETPVSLSVGEQVPGNRVDANPETDNFGNRRIWVNGTSSLSVRCLANDAKTGGKGGDYFCDEIVSEAGALKMFINPDKTITATASDFTSPRSGLVYKFQGFAANSSSSPLIRENPHVLPSSEQRGTFRAYWNTYRQ